MRVDVRVVEGVMILDIDGRIRIGSETAFIRNQLRSLVKAGAKRILLNLADVSEVDSSGVGELAGAYTTVRREGGEVKLVNLTHRLQKLLMVTKLLTVFEVYDNEKEAIASFYRDAAAE